MPFKDIEMPVLTSSKLFTPDQTEPPHQRIASTTRWPKKKIKKKNKVAQKKDKEKKQRRPKKIKR